MSKQSENGSEVLQPSYLDSLKQVATGDDRRCLDWQGPFPCFRYFLLGESKGIADTGTSFSVAASPHGLTLMLRTAIYGYQAEYSDDTLNQILERVDNDLDTATVPWRPDWRRKRENNKRLDV